MSFIPLTLPNFRKHRCHFKRWYIVFKLVFFCYSLGKCVCVCVCTQACTRTCTCVFYRLSASSYAFLVFDLGQILYILRELTIFRSNMLHIFPSLKKDIEMTFGIYSYTVIAPNIFHRCAPSLLSLHRILSFSN